MHDGRGEVFALIQQMREAARDPARVRVLTDQMEVLTRSYLEPSVPEPMPGMRLSKSHSRIFARLLRSVGQVVTKQQLMDAMYFDRIDDEPEYKIVDVQICKLRPRLRATRYRIECAHGRGYVLHAGEC